MDIKYLNLDAGQSVFFNRELEKVKNQSYDVQFPELKAKRLIPVSTDAGAGASSITYQSYEGYGIAKIIASYADDQPRADVGGVETTAKVKSLGSSFGYSIQEVRESQMAGKNLPSRKAMQAREMIERLEDKIAWSGDAKSGLIGLLNVSGSQTYTVINDGTGDVTTWADKSADQILRDMNGVVTQVIDTTLGIENIDTILIPITQYTLINTTARSTNSDLTILEYFKRNNPGISVEWLNQVKGAGTAGADVMLGYKRDPRKLTLEIPQMFEQFPVQERNLEYTIPCHSRIAGVLAYYPLSIIKGEGI